MILQPSVTQDQSRGLRAKSILGQVKDLSRIFPTKAYPAAHMDSLPGLALLFFHTSLRTWKFIQDRLELRKSKKMGEQL